jgi:hypothetical protein
MQGDLSTSEAVENEYRSVAMLRTGQPTYNREEALHVLEALIAALAAVPRPQQALTASRATQDRLPPAMSV